MEQLIIENQNLIYSITKYFEKYASKDDLFQAGCVGMILAHKNYDTSYNTKFTTYAYPYILGEMKKLVRQDKNIKISRDIQKLYLKIEKANILLTQQYMRNPSFEEVANYLEIPTSIVCEAINSMKPIYSMDEPISTDGKDLTLLDVVSKKDSNIDDLILLRDALLNLPKDEKELIEKRYLQDLTQQEVASNLKTSQVQVSRHEAKILTKLKKSIA